MQRLVTGYPSLDWYGKNEKSQELSTFVTKSLLGSDLRILELLVMLFSFYIHRHFPEEFTLRLEIKVNIIVAWIIDWVVNVVYGIRETTEPDLCLLGLWSNSFIDLFRCFTLIGILYWVSASNFQNFPLPFSWVFEDFSKFVFEPRCMGLFLKYVKEKESSRTFEKVNKLMNLFLWDFETFVNTSNMLDVSINNDRPSSMSSTSQIPPTVVESGFKIVSKMDITNSNRQAFMDLLFELEPCYERYKLTRSYKVLKTKVEEFEAITANCANTW